MKLYVDLHIHTALSPCGDNEMTPNNIINMAKIKGLDAVAITDHNSCENVLACIKVGYQAGITVIPGMEVQTREDIHVVTLFEDINLALEFQEYIYSGLPEVKNTEEVFGEQLVLDENDNIIRSNDRMLITSVKYSIDDVFKEVSYLHGTFIPAHVDKQGYSIIYNLGFIPENLNISILEYSSKYKLQNLIKAGILKNKYRFIKSSDAHNLGDILERETFLQVSGNNIKEILESLSIC